MRKYRSKATGVEVEAATYQELRARVRPGGCPWTPILPDPGDDLHRQWLVSLGADGQAVRVVRLGDGIDAAEVEPGSVLVVGKNAIPHIADERDFAEAFEPVEDGPVDGMGGAVPGPVSEEEKRRSRFACECIDEIIAFAYAAAGEPFVPGGFCTTDALGRVAAALREITAPESTAIARGFAVASGGVKPSPFSEDERRERLEALDVIMAFAFAAGGEPFNPDDVYDTAALTRLADGLRACVPEPATLALRLAAHLDRLLKAAPETMRAILDHATPVEPDEDSDDLAMVYSPDHDTTHVRLVGVLNGMLPPEYRLCVTYADDGTPTAVGVVDIRPEA